MARQELHSDNLKIEQRAPLRADATEYAGDVITGESIAAITAGSDYLDQLSFMEEPVVIRLEPSSDKNAATAFPVWVNGQPAQVFQNNRWEVIGYLPVGMPLTVKRKVLEVIIRTKVDTIHTKILDMEAERPNNVVNRYTSPVHSFSILEDRNPRGADWVQEIRRRNL
jgi:hypothetical protein